MKSIVLLLAISISFRGTAQQLTSWKEIKIQRFGKESIYTTKENIPLKGYYKVASDKGNYSEIHFVEGKITGARKNYNTQGKLTGDFKYKEGKPHGKWIYYDEMGKPEAVEHYKDGNKHGRWWEKKLKNGNSYVRTEYYEDNLPVGTWTEKWLNKTLKLEKSYEGLGTYVEKEYHNNGELYTLKSYRELKLHGQQLVYSVSGILLERKTYHNDILEKLEYFFKNGQLDSEYNYENGVLHGKCVDYYPSGGIHWVERYENGYRSGVWKKYLDDNGWLYIEATYKDDILNGTHTTYYSSGIVERKGQYLNGSRNGVWKFYNKAGKLAEEIEYDKGTEIKRIAYKKL